MLCLRVDYASIAMAFLFPTFEKRPEEQEKDDCGKRTPREPATKPVDATSVDSSGNAADEGDTSRKRTTATRPRSSAVEPDAAAGDIQLGSTLEALPGSGGASADVPITSIDDVVSKLAHEPGESAILLCSAARTLQERVQAQVRSQCVCPGVCN